VKTFDLTKKLGKYRIVSLSSKRPFYKLRKIGKRSGTLSMLWKCSLDGVSTD